MITRGGRRRLGALSPLIAKVVTAVGLWKPVLIPYLTVSAGLLAQRSAMIAGIALADAKAVGVRERR